MDKHVLFYSNFCNFSKELIGDITKKNIRDNFILINVDSQVAKNNLPSFVDRVPMIITNKKELVYDDVLIPFIDSIYNSQGPKELIPFTPCNSKFSMFGDLYCALDDDNSGIESHFAKGYVYLGSDKDMQIKTPQEDDNSNSRFDQKQLESFLTQRDRDVQAVHQNIPKPI